MKKSISYIKFPFSKISFHFNVSVSSWQCLFSSNSSKWVLTFKTWSFFSNNNNDNALGGYFKKSSLRQFPIFELEMAYQCLTFFCWRQTASGSARGPQFWPTGRWRRSCLCRSPWRSNEWTTTCSSPRHIKINWNVIKFIFH